MLLGIRIIRGVWESFDEKKIEKQRNLEMKHDDVKNDGEVMKVVGSCS
jgi:hypothetical protein